MKYLTAILLVAGVVCPAEARTPAECHLVGVLADVLADAARKVNKGEMLPRAYVYRAANAIESVKTRPAGTFAGEIGPGLADQIYGRMRVGLDYGPAYRAWLLAECPNIP